MINITYNQHGEIIEVEIDGKKYLPSAVEAIITTSLIYKKSVEELNGWLSAERELLNAITILERGIP